MDCYKRKRKFFNDGLSEEKRLTATGRLAKCALENKELVTDEKFFYLFSCFPFAVMHLGAVAAMLFRYHGNKTIQDVLTRLDTDKLIGTLVFSDPATGMESWYLGAI